MNYKNSSGVYEPLYPNIVASNVIDFSGTNPLLSDATKQLLNNLLNPDKVFDFLGQYNKYWWRKRNYSESSIGNWEYINSTNQNAYPKNTISGGIQYEYLGIPYNNLPGGTIVNYGKYKGTGTYGSGNPNTLTFSRMPKGVIIVPSGSGYGVLGAIFIQGDPQPRGMTALSATSGYLNLNCTWNPNSISWYSTDDSEKQLNDSDTIYYWMSFE